MKDSLLDILDIIKYEILKFPLPPIEQMPNSIEFKPHKEKDGGVWVESDQLPGFYASANNEKELLNEIYETLLVYYNVPRYMAKKLNSITNRSLTTPDGRIISYLPDNKQIKLQLQLA